MQISTLISDVTIKTENTITGIGSNDATLITKSYGGKASVTSMILVLI